MNRCSRLCARPPSLAPPASADPYERLKELTRGKRVTGQAMRDFIAGLGMPADVEARLLALTPGTYVGLAESLVRHLED